MGGRQLIKFRRERRAAGSYMHLAGISWRQVLTTSFLPRSAKHLLPNRGYFESPLACNGVHRCSTALMTIGGRCGNKGEFDPSIAAPKSIVLAIPRTSAPGCSTSITLHSTTNTSYLGLAVFRVIQSLACTNRQISYLEILPTDHRILVIYP